MRPLRRLAALFALLLALAPQLALAHAQLQSSAPEDGATVQTMPGAVTLTFTDDVSPLILRWIAPDGGETEGVGEARGHVLTVPPPVDDSEGTYVLSWRVVSGDGHPVGGALAFHLGAASAQAIDRGNETPAAFAAAALRFLLSLALVAAVGAALHAALIARAAPGARLRSFGAIAAIAAPPLSALFLGVHGLDLTASPAAALLTATPWDAALASPLLRTVLLSALAALAAGAALASARRGAAVFALLAWALAALSYAASGHAANAPPRWLSTGAVFLHAAAAIYWTGALPPLLISLRGPDAALRLQRFSTLAIGAVLLLFVSGLLTIKAQAGELPALFATDYGAVLGVKLAAVAALLALAALNRLRLTPALRAGKPGAKRALARSIGAEILLAALILALAASFRLTPPPRALAAQSAPAYLHLHSESAMADVTVTPSRAGPVAVEIAIRSGDFGDLAPKALDIAFSLASGALEPIRRAARLDEDGLWRVNATLPLAGDWEVTLRVLVTDFESVALKGTVALGQ